MPTVSLHLALSGIALAEEAHVPRLSLMCEIAASRLVDSKNVIDILVACQMQQQRTGNRLPILRKAAMLDCIMVNGSVGIDQLYTNPNFKSNLEERRGLVIPSLLDGTIEVMPSNMNTKDIRKKRDKMVSDRKQMFELTDDSDKKKRITERIKWRKDSVVKSRMEIAYGLDEEATLKLLTCDSKNIWRDTYQCDANSQTTTRSRKRKAASTRSMTGGARDNSATTVIDSHRRQTRKKSKKLG